MCVCVLAERGGRYLPAKSIFVLTVLRRSIEGGENKAACVSFVENCDGLQHAYPGSMVMDLMPGNLLAKPTANMWVPSLLRLYALCAE